MCEKGSLSVRAPRTNGNNRSMEITGALDMQSTMAHVDSDWRRSGQLDISWTPAGLPSCRWKTTACLVFGTWLSLGCPRAMPSTSIIIYRECMNFIPSCRRRIGMGLPPLSDKRHPIYAENQSKVLVSQDLVLHDPTIDEIVWFRCAPLGAQRTWSNSITDLYGPSTLDKPAWKKVGG